MAVRKADYYDDRDKNNVTTVTPPKTTAPAKQTTISKIVADNNATVTSKKYDEPIGPSKPVLTNDGNYWTNSYSKPLSVYWTTPIEDTSSIYKDASYPSYNQGVVGTSASGTYNIKYDEPIGPSKPIVTNDPNYWTTAYGQQPTTDDKGDVIPPSGGGNNGAGGNGGNSGNGGNGGGNAGNGGTGGNGRGTGGGTPSSSQSVSVPMLDPVSDQAYQSALATLANINGSAPVYANSYEQQLTDLYNQIANRDPFSYDLNSDALYRQYAQIYANNGRLAMQDTMGQAAGLTGGYGSSYGQAVGQQQYDRYMQDLNAIVPELYDRAYSHWQDEGDQLLNQYGILTDRADDEYQKYLDTYNQWLKERDYAGDVVNQEYEKYQNDLANYNAQLSAMQSPGGGSSRGGSSKSGENDGSNNNPNLTTDQIKAVQSAAGLPVTGEWDDNTEKAYNAGYGANGSDSVQVPSFKTYSEAVAYMNSKGVDNGKSSGIMTESEWNRRKNAGASSASTSNYATYQDYLKDIVQYNLENK